MEAHPSCPVSLSSGLDRSCEVVFHFLSIHPLQELRLTSYLSKLSLVPLGVLLRLLSLALPSASQPELLAALDSFGQKHPDLVVDGDSREPADAGRQG